MDLIPYGNAEVYDARQEFPDLTDPSKYQFRWRDLTTVDALVIHHWATGVPASDFQGQLAEIRGVYSMWTRPDNIHNTVGFPYHLALFPNGNAFYVGDLYTSRACVEKENWHVICISLAGNYNDAPPDDAFIERIYEITENTRLIMGWKVPIVGHQDLNQTSCPGHTWYDWKYRLDP